MLCCCCPVSVGFWGAHYLAMVQKCSWPCSGSRWQLDGAGLPGTACSSRGQGAWLSRLLPGSFPWALAAWVWEDDVPVLLVRLVSELGEAGEKRGLGASWAAFLLLCAEPEKLWLMWHGMSTWWSLCSFAVPRLYSVSQHTRAAVHSAWVLRLFCSF